jgi:hypothetical protein
MAGQKPNKPRTDEAKRRTDARKAKNLAANQARHEANLALVQQYGIKPRTESRQITEVFKVGNKTIEKSKVLTRNVRASKLVRSARRNGTLTA